MSNNYSDFENLAPIALKQEPEARNEAQSLKTELRPTLVIGLGGSGHTVLTHLKARYLDSFGEEVINPSVLRLISFDTADEVMTAQSEKNGLVQLERGREFVWIGGVQVHSIMNNMDRKPFIKEWFPRDFQPRNITQGAQQVRPLGRLALFESYTKIASELSQAIRGLSSVKGEGIEKNYYTVPSSSGVNIYIVSSICGGTGSGIIFDVAYMLRSICNKQGMPFYHINGYLVMPQAFSHVPSEAIQANAFAALRELDYFYEFQKFEANYPTESIKLEYTKPFDICYLVDGVNERAKTLSGLNELAPLISEAIFLQAASQVGRANDSAFDNVKSLGDVDRGRPTAYSSVGTASIYFPAPSIIEICASRYGQQIIQEGLLSNSPDGKAVEIQVKNFISGCNLEPPALLSEVQRSPQGAAMIIRLDASSLPEVNPNETLGQIDTLVTDFEQNYLNGMYRATLEQNRTQLQTNISNRLTSELKRYMNDPKDYGLLFTIGFLDRLKSQLNRMAQFLDQERTSYSSTYEHEQPDVSAARSNITSAINSNPLGRGGRIKRAKSEYLEVKQRSCVLLFEMMSRQQASVLVSNLLSAIGAAQTSLSKLQDHLRSAADTLDRRFRSQLADKGSNLSPLTTDVTNPNDVSRLYRTYAPTSPQGVAQMLERTGGFYTWVNRPYNEVESRILEFTRWVFREINNVKISEIMTEKRNELSPEARLDKLLQDALPFWNYERARLDMDGELDNIMVLGDEDSTQTIFQLRKAMNIISTRDPHRITALNTKHGLPLFALRQYPDYKERYNTYKRRNISPLHLFPNMSFNDDKGEKEVWQWFALGEAFDLIRQTGMNDYEYVPEDKLIKPLKLGQGLSRSLAGLVQNEEAQIEIQERVRTIWGKIGHDAARQKIEKYMEPPKRLSSGNNTQVEELRNTLRVLAREYLNSIEN